MVFFNYATKEITAKIVYYGPGLSGKTTNLQSIYQNLPADDKGKMVSLATSDDRTLFFDFLPLELGTIRGMRTRIQLYTVPGQVFYNTTRKLVLKGADGVVFVADSQNEMIDHNVESFDNLEKNLKEHGMNLKNMPHILQFNKRDLPNIASVEEIDKRLNKYNVEHFEAIAIKGTGVYECLREIIRQVINKIAKEYGERPMEATGKLSGEKADTKMPSSAPLNAAKEKIPAAAAVQSQKINGSTMKKAQAEKSKEPFHTSAVLDEDIDESWMNELEAGDLEPASGRFDGQSSAFNAGEKENKAFSQKVTVDFQEGENIAGGKITEKKITVPLEIPITKDTKVVRLNINLNVLFKRE
jgi:signal recognition particle receptor subunit beta